MSICENCECEHDGIYGSGRFCSTKCSRGFSTKAKRKEINEKVSNSLKGRKYADPIFCKNCGNELRRRRKYQLCRKCIKTSAEYIQNISMAMVGKNLGSKNGMFGISPKNTKPIQVSSYKHTGSKIFTVRSSYEKRYVDTLNKDKNVIQFTYEPKQFKVHYLDNKKERTYQPDFLVNDNLIVEIKNSWNVTLKETKIKSKAFKNAFNIKYEILVLS